MTDPKELIARARKLADADLTYGNSLAVAKVKSLRGATRELADALEAALKRLEALDAKREAWRTKDADELHLFVKIRTQKEAAEAVLDEFEKQGFFPLGHGEECLLEEDDHAPDFACTCGTYKVNVKLDAWRTAKEASHD